MHDWTLMTISVDWERAVARLEFRWNDESRTVTAVGLSNLCLPRKLPWGPSVSVNRGIGPTKLESGEYSFVIEMQSGDEIELVAQQFEIPPIQRISN